MSELNKEMLEAEFLMQLNFAEFTDSKLTSPMRKEFLEYALSLIKELTEENERLRADTVRKIIQRIKEAAIAISLLSHPPKFMLEIREDALDQIAKEMLEGKG